MSIFKSKKTLTVVIVVLLVVVAVTFIALVRNSNDKASTSNSSQTDSPDTGDSPSINMDPPTKQEQAAGNEQKQFISDQQDNPPKATNNATVIITDANQYDQIVEIRAFVSNRVDKTGTCTVILTQGSSTITRNKGSVIDATTTQCGSIDIPRSEFPSAGQWNVSVSYSSGDASGSANTTMALR